MTSLSPATQAVLDAFRTSHTGQGCLAAALRAAAEHIDDASDGLECQDILLQIADELDAPYSY